jgi:hypothetical protein
MYIDKICFMLGIYQINRVELISQMTQSFCFDFSETNRVEKQSNGGKNGGGGTDWHNISP